MISDGERRYVQDLTVDGVRRFSGDEYEVRIELVGGGSEILFMRPETMVKLARASKLALAWIDGTTSPERYPKEEEV